VRKQVIKDQPGDILDRGSCTTMKNTTAD